MLVNKITTMCSSADPDKELSFGWSFTAEDGGGKSLESFHDWSDKEDDKLKDDCQQSYDCGLITDPDKVLSFGDMFSVEDGGGKSLEPFKDWSDKEEEKLNDDCQQNHDCDLITDPDKVLSFGDMFSVEDGGGKSLEPFHDWSEFEYWDLYPDDESDFSDEDPFYLDEDEFYVLDSFYDETEPLEFFGEEPQDRRLSSWNHPNNLFKHRRKRRANEEFLDSSSDSGSCSTILSFSPHSDEAEPRSQDTTPNKQDGIDSDSRKSDSTIPSAKGCVIYDISDESSDEGDPRQYLDIDSDYYADESDASDEIENHIFYFRSVSANFSDNNYMGRPDSESDSFSSEGKFSDYCQDGDNYKQFCESPNTRVMKKRCTKKMQRRMPYAESDEFSSDDLLSGYCEEEDESTKLCRSPKRRCNEKKRSGIYSRSVWNHPAILFKSGHGRNEASPESLGSDSSNLSYSYHSDDTDTDSPFFTPIKLVDFPRPNSLTRSRSLEANTADEMHISHNDNMEVDLSSPGEQPIESTNRLKTIFELENPT